MLNIRILCRVSFVHRCLGIYGNKLQLKLNANVSFNDCPVILKVHCTYLHLTFARLKAITWEWCSTLSYGHVLSDKNLRYLFPAKKKKNFRRSLSAVIQGVPKVRSSNFMRNNFWSKLLFLHEISIHFELFYHLVCRSHFDPQTI